MSISTICYTETPGKKPGKDISTSKRDLWSRLGSLVLYKSHYYITIPAGTIVQHTMLVSCPSLETQLFIYSYLVPVLWLLNVFRLITEPVSKLNYFGIFLNLIIGFDWTKMPVRQPTFKFMFLASYLSTTNRYRVWQMKRVQTSKASVTNLNISSLYPSY